MSADEHETAPAAAAVTPEAFVDALAAEASRVFALLPPAVAAELARLTADSLALDPHVSDVLSRARPREARAVSGEESSASEPHPDAEHGANRRHG